MPEYQLDFFIFQLKFYDLLWKLNQGFPFSIAR